MTKILCDNQDKLSSKRLAGLIGFACLLLMLTIEPFIANKFSDAKFEILAVIVGGILSAGVFEKVKGGRK